MSQSDRPLAPGSNGGDPPVKAAVLIDVAPEPGRSSFRVTYRLAFPRRFPPTNFTGAGCLSNAGFDLLSGLLAYDPAQRLSAAEALQRPWFDEQPLPARNMPRFEENRERGNNRRQWSPDPLEEQRRREERLREAGGAGGLFAFAS